MEDTKVVTCSECWKDFRTMIDDNWCTCGDCLDRSIEEESLVIL